MECARGKNKARKLPDGIGCVPAARVQTKGGRLPLGIRVPWSGGVMWAEPWTGREVGGFHFGFLAFENGGLYSVNLE